MRRDHAFGVITLTARAMLKVECLGQLIPDPQYVLKSFRIRKLKGASISLRKNVNLKFASALNPDPEQGAKNVESSMNWP